MSAPLFCYAYFYGLLFENCKLLFMAGGFGFLSGENPDFNDFFLLPPGPVRALGRGERLCETLAVVPPFGLEPVVIGWKVHSCCYCSNSIWVGSRSYLLCLLRYYPMVLSVKFRCVSLTSRTELALSLGSKLSPCSSCSVNSFLNWSLCSSYLAAYAYI